MSTVSNIPIINGQFMKVANQGRILPFFKETVYCSFGKNYFSSFIDMWADSEGVCDTEIYHVEENNDCWTITPSAPVAGAPGAAVTFTLSAADHYINGKYSKPQENFPVFFPGVGKMGRITNVDTDNDGAHEVTVVPNDPAYAITVGAGEKIIISPVNMRLDCVCDEGKSSHKLPGIAYRSELMVVSRDLNICGRDLAKWCDNLFLYKMRDPLDPCKEVDVWWHADLNQMFLEFTQGWAMLMMLGEAVTNPAAGDYSSTTGFMPTLRARGSYNSYAAADGFVIADIDAITNKIKGQRGYCTEYGIWAGQTLRQNIDDALGEKFSNGAITYGVFDCDSKKCVNFGFDAFVKNGITFYLHDEDMLNDPCFLGANGFNGPTTGFAVPLCQIQCGNDYKTPIVINYLENKKAGYTRELEQWDFGVLKPETKPDNCDYHKWHLQADKGFEMYCPERFHLIEAL